MKNIFACLFFGLIALYFMDAALSIENLNFEMLTHNLVRFFVGFLFLGIWVWYEHKLKFKISLYFILAFLVSDDIYDYIREVNNLNFEMLIHDLFIVIWGAFTGFLFVKNLHKKNTADQNQNRF